MKKLILIIALLVPFVLSAQTKLTYKTSEVQTLLDKSKSSQVGVFNVLDYGAKGDGSHDDTQAIKNTIAASITHNELETGGSTIYFPIGIYKITDSLIIDNGSSVLNLKIKGEGKGSIIKNFGTKSTLVLVNCQNFEIDNISLFGTGTTFGVNATNRNGIILDHSTYGILDNVTIWYNGGNGVIAYNGVWGIKFYSCSIYYNKIDGVNMIDNSGQDNGGENGNATSFINCNISFNGDDGIEWTSTELYMIGNDVEQNLGSGLQLGSLLSTSGVKGAKIVGNWFEANDSSQIKMITPISPNRYVQSTTIEGNTISGTSSVGDTSLISVKCPNGSFWGALNNVYIGYNSYYKTNKTKEYIDLKGGAGYGTVIVWPTWNTTTDVYMTDGTIEYCGVPMAIPEAAWDGDITAVGGITAIQLRPCLLIEFNSPIDITANPQIVDGFFDGQEMTIIGETSTLKLDNGDGLILSGGTSVTIGRGDVIKLKWIKTLNSWVEMSSN